LRDDHSDFVGYVPCDWNGEDDARSDTGVRRVISSDDRSRLERILNDPDVQARLEEIRLRGGPEFRNYFDKVELFGVYVLFEITTEWAPTFCDDRAAEHYLFRIAAFFRSKKEKELRKAMGEVATNQEQEVLEQAQTISGQNAHVDPERLYPSEYLRCCRAMIRKFVQLVRKEDRIALFCLKKLESISYKQLSESFFQGQNTKNLRTRVDYMMGKIRGSPDTEAIKCLYEKILGDPSQYRTLGYYLSGLIERLPAYRRLREGCDPLSE
jgi:hypothetical protein